MKWLYDNVLNHEWWGPLVFGVFFGCAVIAIVACIAEAV